MGNIALSNAARGRSDAFIGLATLDVSPAKHLVGRRTPGDGEWSHR